MLDAKGDLAVVEVAFFSFTLILTIAVLFRQGFQRQLGWFYIGLLAILQIIGGSALIYYETANNPGLSAVEAYAITSAVGTAPLLLALMGFLQRISQGMGEAGLPQLIFRPFHLIQIGALVLSVVGGVDRSSTTPSTAQTGRACIEASAILFLALFLILMAMTIYLLAKRQYVLAAERKLLYACVVVLPFILVRVIYTICVAFSSTGSSFSFSNVTIWAQAFMQFLMEAVVVIIVLPLGIILPRALQESSHAREQEEGMSVAPGQAHYESRHMKTTSDAYAMPNHATRVKMDDGRYTAVQDSGHRSARSGRFAGVQRPSKMLLNAIADHRGGR